MGKYVAKSFIERLTDEQVIAFLEREYPKKKNYSYKFEKNKTHIYVKIEHIKGTSSIFFLFEFGVGACIHKLQWIKYLYDIFGDEYKDAYLADCAEIFD